MSSLSSTRLAAALSIGEGGPAETPTETPTLRRGVVFWAAPDPTIGSEQSGRRPFIVVASNEYLEQVTNLVLAVPLTTTDRGWPNHVRLVGNTGLDATCFAMTEQVRAISRLRVSRITGSVDDETLRGIDSWLRDFLDLR